MNIEMNQCPAIPMAPVTSNQIAAIGYEPSTNTLAVEFARSPGVTYHYAGVSPETHAGLVAADSIGRYFGQHIRPLAYMKYPAPKASEEQDQ